jgi:hypothetical protein
MSFTRKDAQEMARRRAIQKEAAREPYYRSLAQAEVGAKQLTNNPAWNWFLQILASKKEEAEHALSALDHAARISSDFSSEALSRAQAARLSWQARIEAYVEVMGIPAQILADASKAQEKRKALNYAESEENPVRPAAS